MEKYTYIHCGPAKTGSSAIQSFLNMNSDLLFENGLHYIQSCKCRGGSHNPLAWILYHKYTQQHMSVQGIDFVTNKEKYLSDLKRELNVVSDKSYIVSSETFLDLPSEAIDELLELFKGTKVRVVIYIRNINDICQSLIKQYIKNINNRTRDFRMSTLIKTMSYQYSIDSIDRWSKKIGRENLIFRKYENEYFEGGNIFSDMLDVLGLDSALGFKVDKKNRINNSLFFNETLVFKDLLNRLDVKIPQNLIVRQLLLWEENNVGSIFSISGEGVDRIYDESEILNQYLLKEYLDESFFDILYKSKKLDISLVESYKSPFLDFIKMLSYMDERVDGFGAEFMISLKEALNNAYEKELNISFEGKNEERLSDELKLRNLFVNDKPVALWGIGSVVKVLFERASWLKSDVLLFLVDENPTKYRDSFFGHKVYSPEVINKMEIETVIVTSILYSGEISSLIYKNFPKVINIVELQDYMSMCVEENF